MNGTLRKIKFKEVSAQIQSIEHLPRILIRWDLKETRQDISKLVFNVMRGESPEDMKQVNPIPLPGNTLYEFMDQTVKLRRLDKKYYYRVIATEIMNGIAVQNFESDVFNLQDPPDLVALYIIEEHLFAHRYVYGSPCLIYKEKKEGTRCSCFDPVLKRVTTSSCQICKGTGFAGGYYNPIEAWIEFNPDAKITQIADFGEKQTNQSDIRFTNWPELANDDVIVELKAHRYWKVVRYNVVEKNRTTTLQMARMDEINKSDIEQTIVIPEDVRTRMLEELRERELTPEF